jgi:hypothetical protein
LNRLNILPRPITTEPDFSSMHPGPDPYTLHSA